LLALDDLERLAVHYTLPAHALNHAVLEDCGELPNLIARHLAGQYAEIVEVRGNPLSARN
jgi:hypothetical protein